MSDNEWVELGGEELARRFLEIAGDEEKIPRAWLVDLVDQALRDEHGLTKAAIAGMLKGFEWKTDGW